MIHLVLLAVVAAAPPPGGDGKPAAAKSFQVAFPALTLINVGSKEDPFTPVLAQQLGYHGIRALTPGDMQSILGLERQRQLVGCNDAKCGVELASALGAEAVLNGSVTRAGKSYLLTVRVLAANDASTLAEASTESDDLERFLGTFGAVAEQLSRQLSTKLGLNLQDTSVEVVQGASRVKRLSWLPLIATAGGVALGTAFAIKSNSSYATLTTPSATPLSAKVADDLASSGRSQQTISWVSFGVAVAGAAGAACMFLLGGDEVVRAQASITPGGAGLVFSGELP